MKNDRINKIELPPPSVMIICGLFIVVFGLFFLFGLFGSGNSYYTQPKEVGLIVIVGFLMIAYGIKAYVKGL